MKKHLLTLLFCGAAMAMFNKHSIAQATLIHYWHFNVFTGATYTPTISAVAADYTDLSGSSPRILYKTQTGTSTAYSTYLDGYSTSTSDYDTINARMGATAGVALRTRNPSDSMELLFYTPSTHFNNLVFTYACERSSNGMTHQNYDYSTDGGTTWSTTGLSLLTDSMWTTFHRETLTCTNTAINDNANLVFRIRWNAPVNSFPTDTGTSGNNRFDNVSLDGDTIITSAVTNPITTSAPTSYTLYPNPVTNNVDITSDLDGLKTVMILNAVGETVYVGLEDGKHISINAANLSKGSYFIRIRESVTGSVSTMKFIKM